MAAHSPQTFHTGTGAEAANLGFLAAQPAVLSLTHIHLRVLRHKLYIPHYTYKHLFVG